jgi:hypothetical protein
MTINKECIIKSLKTDYRNIGIAAAACLMVIGAAWGLINLSAQIAAVLAIIAQPFTAVNVFIVSEIIAIGFWVGVVAIADQTTEESKEDMKKADSTPSMICFSSLTMAIVWGMYCYLSFCMSNRGWEIQPPFPDVVQIFLILLVINTFIICPLSVAYARCKE